MCPLAIVAYRCSSAFRSATVHVAYAPAESVDPQANGTEAQVRRLEAGRTACKAFASSRSPEEPAVASDAHPALPSRRAWGENGEMILCIACPPTHAKRREWRPMRANAQVAAGASCKAPGQTDTTPQSLLCMRCASPLLRSSRLVDSMPLSCIFNNMTRMCEPPIESDWRNLGGGSRHMTDLCSTHPVGRAAQVTDLHSGRQCADASATSGRTLGDQLIHQSLRSVHSRCRNCGRSLRARRRGTGGADDRRAPARRRAAIRIMRHPASSAAPTPLSSRSNAAAAYTVPSRTPRPQRRDAVQQAAPPPQA